MTGRKLTKKMNLKKSNTDIKFLKYLKENFKKN